MGRMGDSGKCAEWGDAPNESPTNEEVAVGSTVQDPSPQPLTADCCCNSGASNEEEVAVGSTLEDVSPLHLTPEVMPDCSCAAGSPSERPRRTTQEIWEASFYPGEIQEWGFGGLPISSNEKIFTCCICYEECMVGEFVKFLPCLHKFHSPCIETWLSVKAACPLCKMNLL